MLPIRDHNPSRRFPAATVALIAANLYGFYQELTAPDPAAFIETYALVPASVAGGDPATLLPFVTHMFLHAGWLHLLSNMWFLWIFGDNAEDRMGMARFVLLYLAAGIAGAGAQYLIAPESAIPMLGASGAVAGVLGAYLMFFPRHRVDTLVPFFGLFSVVPLPAMVLLGYWFALQLISGAGLLAARGASAGGVAYLAHAGGFAAGLALAAVYAMRGGMGKRRLPGASAIMPHDNA